MSLLDTVTNVASNVVNAGENVVNFGTEVGGDLVDGAVTVGSAVADGTGTAVNFAARGLQFQADVTRVGLETAWNGAQAAGTATANFAGRAIDTISHPGDPTPPASQGLDFAETKGASDLAYDANVGEVYRFGNGTEWQVADVVDDPQTGFRAVALQSTNPNDNRTIVAYAGTRNGNDWDDNIAQGAGLSTPQYQQAVDFANKWKGIEGSGNVILTGHSLGGGLASFASINTGLPATAVNSAPLALDHLGLNPFAAGRITQYYVPGEALSVVNKVNPLDVRPGLPIAVQGRDSYFDPRSIGSNHGLDNVAPDVAGPVRVR